MATKDEIADPHNLRLWLKLNGETLQDSNTSDFIFDIPKVVSYISEFMTLLPGDIISTGSPERTPVPGRDNGYLQDGDRVDIEIGGVGILSNPVVNDPSAS